MDQTICSGVARKANILDREAAKIYLTSANASVDRKEEICQILLDEPSNGIAPVPVD